MKRLFTGIIMLAAIAGCGNFQPPPGGYQPMPAPYVAPFYPISTNHGAPAPAPSYQQQGQTANWTGKSTYAQSVTGLNIIQCEYWFAGRTFVRNFQGTCPSSIQIQ